MKIWGLGQISADEKNDILSKHRELYNGYQTMQPEVKNTQPLFVQDFANDKGGLVVNNKGEVKPYTNMGINEQVESKEVCDECGSMQMSEGECSECGWKGEMGTMEEQIKDAEVSVFDTDGNFLGHEKPLGDMETGDDKAPSFDTKGNFLGMKKPLGDMEENTEGYDTGKLSDIYNVEDLGDNDFDYVEGGGNDYGTFEKMHHMKKIKSEQIEDDYEDPDNEDDGFEDLQVDGGEMYEQGFTGGGNAPDTDLSNIKSAYNFKTKGPEEGDGPYTRRANDMDLDDEDVWEPYDFESGGATSGGDAFPQFEAECDECWEKMESAWSEEEQEIEEQDISGVQGIYGAMKPAYDFDSDGPGKAGPYQRSSWSEGSEEDGEIEVDTIDDKPTEDELKTFDPKDKSWSEINDFLGTDELEHLDEDLKESVIKQQNKIIEMFNRMKVIK